MKLENQQVNLELSQQLKKAGYPQEGLWWWVNYDMDMDDDYELSLSKAVKECNLYKTNTVTYFVAPTVAELGEVLPLRIKSLKTEDYWLVDTSRNEGMEEKFITADTEANARAKMWLYLKKENLL